jgi:hypothetical protein
MRSDVLARRALRCLWPALAAITASCGGSGGFEVGALPVLEFRVDGQAVADGATATLALPSDGERRVGTLELVNTGTGPLRIDAITVDPGTPAGLWLELPALPIELEADGGAAGLAIPIIGSARLADAASPELLVRVDTDVLLSGAQGGTLRLLGARPAGRLEVSPSAVDFGTTGAAEVARELALFATGAAAAEVERMTLHGAAGFGVEGPDGPVFVGELPDAGVLRFDPPLVIEGGTIHTRRVYFSADGGAGATGTLEIHTTDGLSRVVALSANTHAPCLVAAPDRLEFGTRLVGQTAEVGVTLRSCGTGPVTLGGVALDATSHEGFSLAELPSLPLELAPNATVEVRVRYLPVEESAQAAGGALSLDLGALVITSDAPVPELAVPLSGAGALSVPPTPVILIAEGDEVIPQTRLHLSGTQSYGLSPITRYSWSVEQPDGAVSVLLPSLAAPEPTFDANVAGIYRFYLTVEDADGVKSPEPAVAEVAVVPDEAIHIELLWDTPGDVDPTDEGPEAGADLDLHFVHPFAAGDGWFDIPFDCFWFNPHPNWASLAPQIDDNPGLDRDDTDGGGPENVNLGLPESGLTYRVGVHYWSDHGFGPSTATVRVYIYDELRYEASCELLPLDLWDAARVSWPSGDVVGVGAPGACVVTPNLQPPGFFARP